MPPRQPNQTKLTFEPTGATSNPSTSAYSPARVRYAKASQNSPAARSSPMAASSSLASGSSRRTSRRKQKQGRLDDSIPPPASFMPRQTGRRPRALEDDSSSESAVEIGDGGYDDDDDDVDLLPPTQMASKPQSREASDSEDSDDEPIIVNPKSSQSVSTRLKNTVISDDSDEEESEPPKLSSPRKRRRSAVSRSDDSDDAPVLPPNSKGKISPHTLIELDDSDSDVISPLKKRKIARHSSPSTPVNNRTPGRLKRPGEMVSSPTKKPHKGHRSDKQKKMELLRRRRAGEKIQQLTSSESSSGEDEKRGIYDSDSEGNFEALKEFDDEEEEVEVQEQPAQTKKKHKRKREKSADKENSESDLEDFVTDDDDALLGAPVDIPLEFTSHAHKPLKDQFPFVIEWLVHNRVNPAFDRKDPVYVNAWHKLDDEVSGLANSKFTSAAWKLDFNRALKSRPRLETFPLAQIGTGLYDTCQACGRSGHPSTFRVIFSGSPYYKDTLAEVESDSEDDDDDNDAASVDEHGMELPPATKEWSVGSVCCSNAETAHSLLHWKHALKEWVEARLDDEGWMTPQKLSEREKMKAKKRRALANQIVDDWQERRVVAALYGDFKNTIENARNQATTGRGARGKFR
ncbi:hypothetical protein F5B22DRAFT_648433 [Xylaria bambusicola]|uniref:uncharacterized protein n=1 Tax=Xylaria bambusicola TaxID=326684 RepID=UPI002008AB02|nr:uncharacterized protein F5B22DRAFT_648433 [Xylaria bambusicola]KAI0512581.1 hypothetical protein F5B22DRAFT_648433 [Xylaria bambusicola]